MKTEATKLALLKKENHGLRVLLASAPVGFFLHADDGKLQDNRRQPFIDFKRDSLGEIESKMAQRALAIITYEDIEQLREQPGADQDELDALERHLDNEAFGGLGWIP